MERTERMTQASAPARTIDGSYLDWAAIAGGAVVAVAVGSVFAAFGASLGLSTISAEPGEGSFNVMIIVTAVWIVVSLVASYAAGGYLAGRMRRRVDSASADEVTVRDGMNGLVVWGLGIVVSVMLLGSVASTTVSAAGDVAAGAGSAVGGAVAAAGSAVGGAAEGAMAAVGAAVPEEAAADPLAYVTDTLLRPTTATAPTGTATDTGADPAASAAVILSNVLATGEINDADRAYLVSAVQAVSGVPAPEAQARTDAAITATQETRAEAERLAAEAQAEAERLAQEAEQMAIEAAETARISAILTGFILAAAALVGGAAAYGGAVRGGRHRDEGRIFGGFAWRN